MNPYESLGDDAFWSKAVARRDMLDIEGLWSPKSTFRPRAPVATFGSCFAQHIGRALVARGYNWMDAEPAPAGLDAETAKAYNFGVFSARTGNIYTASLLEQWVAWAFGDATPPDEVWEKDGRFYDPFRPRIEPDGFASAEEVVRCRQATIDAFRTCLTEARVLVFTLGLTESWFNRRGEYEYPMCPGTVAGEFDPDQHEFVNQGFAFIRKRLSETLKRLKKENPKLSVILTVSPVPLTATMSGKHVLVATVQSKSILRAVAGSLSEALPFVDYFPSFEIISSAPFRGVFYEENQRGVRPEGVAHVMSQFFAGLTGAAPERDTQLAHARPATVARANRPPVTRPEEHPSAEPAEDLVCEEALLDAFGKKDGQA